MFVIFFASSKEARGLQQPGLFGGKKCTGATKNLEFSNNPMKQGQGNLVFRASFSLFTWNLLLPLGNENYLHISQVLNFSARKKTNWL
jgi:hypothetical protein